VLHPPREAAIHAGSGRDRLLAKGLIRLDGEIRSPGEPAFITAMSRSGLRLASRVLPRRRTHRDKCAVQFWRLSGVGDSRPSSRARVTASARLCTPSFAYTLRRCVLTVFSDTNSSAAISEARRLVGR